MALVDVVDGRMDVERVQRAHAADAEQELLADAVLAVAAVERVRHPRDVEEVERHRADVVAPDRGPDELAAEVDFDVHPLEVAASLIVFVMAPAEASESARYGRGTKVAVCETATVPSRPRATATASTCSCFPKRSGSTNAR